MHRGLWHIACPEFQSPNSTEKLYLEDFVVWVYVCVRVYVCTCVCVCVCVSDRQETQEGETCHPSLEYSVHNQPPTVVWSTIYYPIIQNNALKNKKRIIFKAIHS
jgi:hypothetical protein